MTALEISSRYSSLCPGTMPKSSLVSWHTLSQINSPLKNFRDIYALSVRQFRMPLDTDPKRTHLPLEANEVSSVRPVNQLDGANAP